MQIVRYSNRYYCIFFAKVHFFFTFGKKQDLMIIISILLGFYFWRKIQLKYDFRFSFQSLDKKMYKKFQLLFMENCATFIIIYYDISQIESAKSSRSCMFYLNLSPGDSFTYFHKIKFEIILSLREIIHFMGD